MNGLDDYISRYGNFCAHDNDDDMTDDDHAPRNVTYTNTMT